MTTRLSSMLRVLGVLALVAMLAACARIPLSGPVTEGQAVAVDDPQGLQFLPDAPSQGDSPEEIVRGFLEAGTGTQRNYETARKFLTADFASVWNPTARTLVYSGTPNFTQVDGSTVRVDVVVIAEVGPTGGYVEFAAPDQVSLDYRLVSENGEWRIAGGEDGIVLMREWFLQVYEPFTLYFFDSTFRYLVPDVRWFPNASTAPTRITQALLEGPVEWLAEGSVSSAFPAGTTLRGSVTIEHDVAHADFSQNISTGSNERFSLMLKQLHESLVGFSGIVDVQMSANGAPLDISPPADGTVQDHALVNASPLVYRDGTLGYLSGDTLTPPSGSEGMLAMLENLGATDGTVAADQGFGAFVTPGGIVMLPFDGAQPIAVDARDELATPSIDPFGFIWTVSGTSPVVLLTSADNQIGTELTLGHLGHDGVLSLQVSRDGARLAALVRDGASVQLVVASIERPEGAGEPTGIGAPMVIPLGAGTPVELTWVDETSIAVLVDDGEGMMSVRLHQLGGRTSEYGAVEGAVQIAGSNTLAGLRLVDAEGMLFVPRNNRWQAQGSRVDFLVTQA